MRRNDETYEGTCLCGTVRVTARGIPHNVRICHCRNCQRAVGGPFFARAFFDVSQVTIRGTPAEFVISGGRTRIFCRRCGTPIGVRRTDGSGISLALTIFDNPDVFTPTEHIWVGQGRSWARLDDGLPRFRRGVPADLDE